MCEYLSSRDSPPLFGCETCFQELVGGRREPWFYTNATTTRTCGAAGRRLWKFLHSAEFIRPNMKMKSVWCQHSEETEFGRSLRLESPAVLRTTQLQTRSHRLHSSITRCYQFAVVFFLKLIWLLMMKPGAAVTFPEELRWRAEPETFTEVRTVYLNSSLNRILNVKY